MTVIGALSRLVTCICASFSVRPESETALVTNQRARTNQRRPPTRRSIRIDRISNWNDDDDDDDDDNFNDTNNNGWNGKETNPTGREEELEPSQPSGVEWEDRVDWEAERKRERGSVFPSLFPTNDKLICFCQVKSWCYSLSSSFFSSSLPPSWAGNLPAPAAIDERRCVPPLTSR